MSTSNPQAHTPSLKFLVRNQLKPRLTLRVHPPPFILALHLEMKILTEFLIFSISLSILYNNVMLVYKMGQVIKSVNERHKTSAKLFVTTGTFERRSANR